MKAASQRHALMATALAVSLQGCATKPAATLEVRPTEMASARMSAADGLYNDAVAAIDRRDYARALDLLQASRDRGGDSARVLNGFGVVYDKLGRFDLSQRYYSQAQALDPASKIVAQNLAYSRMLQGEAPTAGTALAEAPARPQASSPAPMASPTPVTDRPALARADADRPAMASVSPLVGPAPPLATSSRGPSAVAAAPLLARLAPVLAPHWLHEEAPPQVAATAPHVAPQQVAALRSTPGPQPATAVHAPPAPAPHPLSATAPLVGPAPPLATASRGPSAVAAAPLLATVARLAPLLAPHWLREEAPQAVAAAPQLAPPQVAARRTAPAPASRAAVASVAVRTTIAPKPHPLVATASARGQVAPSSSHVTPGRTQLAAAKPIVRKAQQLPSISAARPTNARLASAPTQRGTRLASASPALPVRAPTETNGRSALLGRPILVVYAGGGKHGADQLRSDLARRGWTVSVASARFPAQARTTIRYAPATERIALALGRSLRTPVKLERCRTRCTGVTILMGAKGTLRVAGADRDGARGLG